MTRISGFLTGWLSKGRGICRPLVVGLLLLAPCAARADVDLWPLVEVAPESTTVLYPLYVHEGRFLMVCPLYYRTNEGRDHHVLWPLFKLADGRVARVVPFWFSGQDSEATIFPFIRQTPDYTLWFVPPMYFRKDGAFTAVFPFFIKTATARYVFPNLYWEVERDRLSHLSVFPLYSRSVFTDGSAFNVLYLFGRSANQAGSESWALPFYYRRTDARDHLLWALPFYYRHTDDRDDRLWAFPYYRHTSPGRSTQWALPFFMRKQTPEARTFWLLPFLRSASPTRTKTAFYPLFRVSTERQDTESAPAAETRQSLWVLWPLYSRQEVADAGGKLVERYRRFLVFSDRLDRNGVRTLRLFGVPVSETTR